MNNLLKNIKIKSVIFGVFMLLIIIFFIIFIVSSYPLKKNKNINFKCGDSVTDFNGNHYKTLNIGEKCWTMQNIKSQNDSDGINTKRLCYDDSEVNCDKFGGLYAYQDAFFGKKDTHVQGLCPPGWHIPSLQEYKDFLSHYLKIDCDIFNNNGNFCELEKNEYGFNDDKLLNGGSCDLLCNYQNCSYMCSGINCRSSFIFSSEVKIEDEKLLLGKRLVIDSCDSSKIRVGVMDGGIDSSMSLRCVKD